MFLYLDSKEIVAKDCISAIRVALCEAGHDGWVIPDRILIDTKQNYTIIIYYDSITLLNTALDSLNKQLKGDNEVEGIIEEYEDVLIRNMLKYNW